MKLSAGYSFFELFYVVMFFIAMFLHGMLTASYQTQSSYRRANMTILVNKCPFSSFILFKYDIISFKTAFHFLFCPLFVCSWKLNFPSKHYPSYFENAQCPVTTPFKKRIVPMTRRKIEFPPSSFLILESSQLSKL